MVVVVVPRRKPDGCDAKILQVGQAIDNTLQIATVIIELIVAIVDTTRLQGLVVCQIAIAETIDHNHVQHVRWRKPLKSTLAIQWSENFEYSLSAPFGRGDL